MLCKHEFGYIGQVECKNFGQEACSDWWENAHGIDYWRMTFESRGKNFILLTLEKAYHTRKQILRMGVPSRYCFPRDKEAHPVTCNYL